MKTYRSVPKAFLMNDGSILVVGGNSVINKKINRNAELFIFSKKLF